MRQASLLLWLCLWLATAATASDWEFRYILDNGVTENLLGDSTGGYDAHTSSGVEISYAPLPLLRAAFSGEQIYYREHTGLSSLAGKLDLTCLPLAASSPFSLLLESYVYGIAYHDDYSGYDNTVAEFQAALGYRLTPGTALRLGVSHTSTSYHNSETGYRRDYELFAGLNTAFWGNNSLDIETGFASTNYDFKDTTAADSLLNPDDLFPTPYPDWPIDRIPNSPDRLWIYYISPRLSRSVGEKTGISLVYTRRLFQNYDRQILRGFTTTYLSPWAAVWEGESLTASIKSYLVPRLIVTAGAGYWDKTYLRTIDNGYLYFNQPLRDVARQDWQSRYFIGARMPLTLPSGLLIEPSLRVEYTDNRSNKPLFSYTNLSISGGFTLRL